MIVEHLPEGVGHHPLDPLPSIPHPLAVRTLRIIRNGLDPLPLLLLLLFIKRLLLLVWRLARNPSVTR